MAEEKITFDNLNLKDDLLRGIYSYGFENPSKIQTLSIPIINEKNDLIAQAQSGTGKTGSYTIGCLNNIDEKNKNTQLLIILPTRELVYQVDTVIEEISKYMKLSIMKVIGGTNVNECKKELEKIPQIIIGTPGRLIDMMNQKYLFTDHIKMVVLDEADEILSYGFKDSIYNIIRYIPKETNIYLFSATMPDNIIELTDHILNNPKKLLINNDELTLEGIKQYYIDVKVNDWKIEIIKDLYDTINISQCIVYFNSKIKLIDVYNKLLIDKYPVELIHGDLSSNERNNIMNEFKNGHVRILLSTDLLSRGIDIQQLSLVINFDLPKIKETYIHRIGRSGRYGRKGVAINFVTKRDDDMMDEIIKFYNTKINELPNNVSDILSI